MRRRIISGLGCWFIVASVLAQAPVVEHSSGSAVVASGTAGQPFAMPASSSADGSLPTRFGFKSGASEQRLNKLEQQVNNLNDQALPRKLEELQQDLQKLNGQVESQAHQIEQLEKNLKDFYQDLNQRLGVGKGAAPHEGGSVIPEAGVSGPAEVSLGASGGLAVVPAVAGKKVNDNSKPLAANATDSDFFKEQQAYQTAIDLLPDKKHESENKLREYLKQYPHGAYVANAHYWLGEINFLQKSFDAAEEEFNLVVKKYAKSKRVADAMLKLALVHQNQGREVEAKHELQKVVKLYPGTPAARLAKQQLPAG